MEALVLIPARNEEATIRAVVRGALDHVPRVVVVADHCTDGTAREARAAGAEVWTNPGEPGKARALRAAWRRLQDEAGWTHLVLMDGDGQHDAADLPRLLAAVRPGLLVVGSRAPFAAPMPWLRRWTNRLMSALVSFHWRVRVPDSQCGFRVVPRILVEQGRWTAQRFEIESEMIGEAVRLGLGVVSVPVACRYPRGARASHIDPSVDTSRWIAWLGRAWMARGG
jgi:glycosyltransferase involved in cell wall biosynthesis